MNNIIPNLVICIVGYSYMIIMGLVANKTIEGGVLGFITVFVTFTLTITSTLIIGKTIQKSIQQSEQSEKK